MPNWCINRLDIDGNEKSVERFLTENKTDDSPLSFAESVPTENPDTDWGTKWDACDVRLNQDRPNSFYFDTAWAPPVEWLEKVAPKYPDLVFDLSFAEPGMDFCGQWALRDCQTLVGWDQSLDLEFAEERGLLNWPECYECGGRLSHERAYGGEVFCPPCEENDMMMRGRAA